MPWDGLIIAGFSALWLLFCLAWVVAMIISRWKNEEE